MKGQPPWSPLKGPSRTKRKKRIGAFAGESKGWRHRCKKECGWVVSSQPHSSLSWKTLANLHAATNRLGFGDRQVRQAGAWDRGTLQARRLRQGRISKVRAAIADSKNRTF